MKTIQVNFLYEKLQVIDEQSFAKKILILCLICFIYTPLQSFLCIRTMVIKKAKNFKYLDSTISNDARCEEEVRRRIQAGWISRREVSGVLCNKKLSAKVKNKIYKSIFRLTILYGMETVAVMERQMGKMELAELKMVRCALGMTKKDKIR